MSSWTWNRHYSSVSLFSVSATQNDYSNQTWEKYSLIFGHSGAENGLGETKELWDKESLLLKAQPKVYLWYVHWSAG